TGAGDDPTGGDGDAAISPLDALLDEYLDEWKKQSEAKVAAKTAPVDPVRARNADFAVRMIGTEQSCRSNMPASPWSRHKKSIIVASGRAPRRCVVKMLVLKMLVAMMCFTAGGYATSGRGPRRIPSGRAIARPCIAHPHPAIQMSWPYSFAGSGAPPPNKPPTSGRGDDNGKSDNVRKVDRIPYAEFKTKKESSVWKTVTEIVLPIVTILLAIFAISVDNKNSINSINKMEKSKQESDAQLTERPSRMTFASQHPRGTKEVVPLIESLMTSGLSASGSGSSGSDVGSSSAMLKFS
ncbi:hypothetical protein T492DRAFT_888328, partial [Pavlovales sp. CCMP2436]